MPKLHLPFDGPLALSLSGGGSKGAYTAGVLQYLAEVPKRRDFNMIYGTSTGALAAAAFAVYVATGDIQYLGNLLKIYRTVKQGDILNSRQGFAEGIAGEVGALLSAAIKKDDSIYSAAPLAKLTEKFMPDKLWDILFKAADKGDLEVGFAAAALQSGEVKIFSTKTHQDAKVMRAAMMASASQPVFMEPVLIPGEGDKQWVDGGLRDYNPVERLFASDFFDDVKAVISVHLDNPKLPVKDEEFKDVGSIFFRTLEILTGSVGATDIRAAQLWNVILQVKGFLSASQWKQFVQQLPLDVKQFTQSKLAKKDYVPILRVIPLKPIKQSSLKFQQPAMKQLVKRGFREAAKMFVSQIQP